MFSINKETDYALSAINFLSKNKNEYVSISLMSSKLGISKKYLSRILPKIVDAKIIKSKEGKNGGYMLVKDIENINLYEFLKVFENDLEFVKCNSKCLCKHCEQKEFFSEYLKNEVINILKKKQLNEIFKSK